MIGESFKKQYLSVFKLINKLNEKEFDGLIDGFNSSEIMQSNASLLRELEAKSSLKTQELQKLLEFLFSLRSLDEPNLEELITDIEEVLLKNEIAVKPNFNENIKGLFLNFTKSNVLTTIKGISLIYERERLVIEKKIYTDLRPIYGNDKGENSLKIKAESVMLNLYITFRNSNNNSEQIIFAIDEKDLNDLEMEINRAKNKLSTLKKDRKNLIF